MYSYTFPYKEGRVFRDLEGGFWGREGGVAIYENAGFPVSKPGVAQSQSHACRTQRTLPYWKYYGIVNYYAVVFLLCLPNLLRCEPLSEGKNACKTQEKCVSAGVVAIVNSLRRSIFSTAGSFGKCVVKFSFFVNLIWNLKSLMWNIWWNSGVRLFDRWGNHQTFRGEFRGEFWQNFRKLRFKFRVFSRKLCSAEGRC